MRLIGIFLLLAIAVLVPFAIWGDLTEAAFSGEAAVAWLRGFGAWAWLAGIALLMADLFLPLPSTAIISALGLVYGAVLGGLVGAAGSFLSGALAYALCRSLGRPAAEFIAGRDDLARGERTFAQAGGWIVALSRWLPVLPEVIACMAGLVRMPAARFLAALACGSIPLGFTFASIGAAGVAHPGMAILFSALLPPVLWLIVSRALRRMRE